MSMKRIYFEKYSRVGCALILGLGLVAAKAPDTPQLTFHEQEAPSSRPATVKLNSETIGTTADLSLLSTKLQNIFAARLRNRAYVAGMETRSDLPESDRIEKSVFIEADRTINIEVITNVVETLLDAGASPILFPIYGPKRTPTGIRLKPNPLTLMVRLAESEPRISQGQQSITRSEWPPIGEIPVTISSTNADSVASLRIANEGEFILEGKRIAKVALEKEIRERVQASSGKKAILFKAQPGVSYGVLKEFYTAAYAAGAKRIDLERFFNWNTGKTVKAPIADLTLTVPNELVEEVSSTPEKNGEITWTVHDFTWSKPRLSVEVDVTVTNWDKDFPPEARGFSPEVLLERRYLLTEEEKSTGAPIEELRYLEIDGVKGIFFRAAQLHDRNRIWLNWQTLRYHKGKAQQLHLSIQGNRSDLDKLMAIIHSISLGSSP